MGRRRETEKISRRLGAELGLKGARPARDGALVPSDETRIIELHSC